MTKTVGEIIHMRDLNFCKSISPLDISATWFESSVTGLLNFSIEIAVI
ncbi:MAG: hypothetical protein O3C43_12390 [Verrucomicrobia bacterium]|nr:hypothetical protein [Verrucomicrobiota bacterium]MDA1067291.1 hypothetical protein [Verrucomicrobiota bacterium]